MEKAILKTLIYADIFDYPLNRYEIHKWLIGEKISLRQVEKALGKLIKKRKIRFLKGYFFLSGQNNLIRKRLVRSKQSNKYLNKLKVIAPILKLVPWVKLVGISGGLAMGNADKKDDIDLILITSKNRLWVSRLLVLGLLSIIGQRRKVGDKGGKIAGKLCLNILLEEDRLGQIRKDIYLAHEVLQMKVLWQRNGVYSKYLEDNSWVFKFLPNWVGQNNTSSWQPLLQAKEPKHSVLEVVAKRLQLKLMKKPQGLERIEEGALYFHPQDCRQDVLTEYYYRTKKISRA